MKFSELKLHDKLMQGISDAGFEDMMPVQEQTLEHTLKGRDVEVQSQTGTGKTAAFLVTIFQHFLDEKSPIKQNKALIIAPTRELAVQIEKDAKILGKHLDYTIGCFYGGVGYHQQERLIEQDVDVIIGTPGRLLDFSGQKKLDFRKIGFLVIDEADRLLDMGFLPDIRRIMRRMEGRTERQIMLFSATLDVDTRSIGREFMKDAATIEITPEKVTVDEITQVIYHVAEKEKMSLMLGILKKELPGNALIFTNMKHTAAQVAKHLEYNGYKCQYLSGDLPQSKRLRVINNFKSGKLSYLVATDVAARGLHIEDLEMIINYDLPGDCENYVHRIGRTARAGKSGKAVSLACEHYVYNLEAIESFLGMKIPVGIAEDDLYHEDKGAGIDFRKEVRRGTTSRAGRSREKTGRKKSPVRHKKTGSKKTAETQAKKTRDNESRKTRETYSKQRKSSEVSGTRSRGKAKPDTKAPAKGKGKGRGKAAAAAQGHKEQAERRHPAKKKKSRDTVAVGRGENPKTGISTFEDRLEYYRKKYGENFSPEEAARYVPQKKSFFKKITGMFKKRN
jgi:ATP-dependent RNA helicase RhlB